jgi:hypothetical protein
MIVKYNIASIAMAALAMPISGTVLFNCGGKGGDDKWDHLRKEYQRDPDGYRKKWGV